MKRPTVSVVLPHYNHGRYVEASVAALLGQSVPPLELLLIDDASTDGSGPILERLAKDPRVRLIRHERNQGVFATLMEGLRLAKGDYVFPNAADDLYLPGIFEKSLDLLAAHPEAGFCCSLAGILSEDGRDLGPYRTPVVRDRPSYLAPEEFRAEYMRRGSWVASYTCIYRRDAALAVLGAIDADLGPTLDGFLIHALGGRHGACFIPERLAMWRRLETSYAGRYGRDVEASLRVIDALGRALRALTPRVHDEGYLEVLRRRGVEETLNNLAHAPEFSREAALRAAAALPGGAWDGLYRAALAAGAGRRATKLFLFPKRPAGEMLRIAGRKLGF